LVSGRGAAWLARLLGVQEVPSSNLGGPTKSLHTLTGGRVLAYSVSGPSSGPRQVRGRAVHVPTMTPFASCCTPRICVLWYRWGHDSDVVSSSREPGHEIRPSLYVALNGPAAPRHGRRRPRYRFAVPLQTRYRVVKRMSDMADPGYESAKRSVQALGPADQLRLIAELAASLRNEDEHAPRRSLLELQGLGKSIWQGVDVEEYLRRERASWNG
jgi:hypothetical protein